MAEKKPENSLKKVKRLPAIEAEPSLYNEIAKNAKLNLVQMLTSTFRVRPEFFSERSEVVLSFEHSQVSCSYYESDAVVTGMFEYSIRGKIGRRIVIECIAGFMTVYDVGEGADEDAANAYCSRVGLYAAYPYFRALVAHVASLASADLPIMPTISTQPLKKKSVETERVA